MNDFSYTNFSSIGARFKEQNHNNLNGLREVFLATKAERKDLLPWIKLALFGSLTTAKGSLRHDANVIAVTGCEGDYDGGTIGPDEAIAKLSAANVSALVYTSPSHTPDKPRWRVVCPFSCELHPAERPRMVARLNGVLGGVLSPESFTLSQSYYIGHLGTGHEQATVVNGYEIDTLNNLDATAIGKSGNKQTAGNGAGDGGPHDYTELAELIRRIVCGESLHPSVTMLAGKFARDGIPIQATIDMIGEAFAAAHQPRYSNRWNECVEAVDWVYAKEQKKQPQTPTPVALLKSSAAFIADFVPPNYLVKRVLIQSYLYALTGQTGTGKTAITLMLAASVALGRPFAGLKTKPGRVLYLAAENPDDVRNRWIALAQQMDFDPDTIPVWFITSIFNITELSEQIRDECAAAGGDFILVIIDTGPAFFQGADTNDRVDMFKHARMMRDLIDIVPGRPTILANMHPTKNANADNLVPAGGGSFLNEIDGNLTATKDGAGVELYWQGKFRGAEFNPINFEVLTVTHERLKDDDGDLIPTVIARHISETAKEDMEKAAQEDWKTILGLIDNDPAISLGRIATSMGWDDKRWKAQNVTIAMTKRKLLKRDAMGKWELTPAGREILDDFRKTTTTATTSNEINDLN